MTGQPPPDLATTAPLEDIRRVKPVWSEMVGLVDGARRRGFTPEQVAYLESCLGVTWATATRRALAPLASAVTELLAACAHALPGVREAQALRRLCGLAGLPCPICRGVVTESGHCGACTAINEGGVL